MMINMTEIVKAAAAIQPTTTMLVSANKIFLYITAHLTSGYIGFSLSLHPSIDPSHGMVSGSFP